MSVFDIDNYTDAVSDAVDAIGDAGDLIGAVLKSVSPLLGMVPGIGTAFSVAVYAAGAIAAKDSITDAMIGTASAAMPPGVPRIAFDGAAHITRDVAQGRPVKDSAIAACRQAAQNAGGDQAAAAFDSAIKMLEGGPVDQRLIDAQRARFLQTGGTSAAASFDAAVAIARGKTVDQVVIDVARGYISQMGGPVALAAFDTGVALGYAKTLQEAGYIGLHTLVRGNDGIEKILNFIEHVSRARSLKEGVQQLLEEDLAKDFLRAINQYVSVPDGSVIDRALKPYIDTIRDHPELLDLASGDLARQWDVEEGIIRAAQGLMRHRDGVPDARLMAELKRQRVIGIGRIDVGGDAAGTKERNDALAARGRQMASGDAELTAYRSHSRQYRPELWERGFDVGSAMSYRQSQFGPGQAAVRDSLLGASQTHGYDVARDLQYRRTIALHEALDGLTKQVTSGRDIALAAFATSLGAAGASPTRSQKAAVTIPVAPPLPGSTVVSAIDEQGYAAT